MQRDNAPGPPATTGHGEPWPVEALLAVGAWLVVSPLVLSTIRVTAGAVSAVAGGLAVAVLAGWALLASDRVPPLAGVLILLLTGSALLADRRRRAAYDGPGGA